MLIVTQLLAGYTLLAIAYDAYTGLRHQQQGENAHIAISIFGQQMSLWGCLYFLTPFLPITFGPWITMAGWLAAATLLSAALIQHPKTSKWIQSYFDIAEATLKKWQARASWFIKKMTPVILGVVLVAFAWVGFSSFPYFFLSTALGVAADVAYKQEIFSFEVNRGYEFFSKVICIVGALFLNFGIIVKIGALISLVGILAERVFGVSADVIAQKAYPASKAHPPIAKNINAAQLKAVMQHLSLDKHTYSETEKALIEEAEQYGKATKHNKHFVGVLMHGIMTTVGGYYNKVASMVGVRQWKLPLFLDKDESALFLPNFQHLRAVLEINKPTLPFLDWEQLKKDFKQYVGKNYSEADKEAFVKRFVGTKTASKGEARPEEIGSQKFQLYCAEEGIDAPTYEQTLAWAQKSFAEFIDELHFGAAIKSDYGLAGHRAIRSDWQSAIQVLLNKKGSAKFFNEDAVEWVIKTAGFCPTAIRDDGKVLSKSTVGTDEMVEGLKTPRDKLVVLLQMMRTDLADEVYQKFISLLKQKQLIATMVGWILKIIGFTPPDQDPYQFQQALLNNSIVKVVSTVEENLREVNEDTQDAHYHEAIMDRLGFLYLEYRNNWQMGNTLSFDLSMLSSVPYSRLMFHLFSRLEEGYHSTRMAEWLLGSTHFEKILKEWAQSFTDEAVKNDLLNSLYIVVKPAFIAQNAQERIKEDPKFLNRLTRYILRTSPSDKGPYSRLDVVKLFLHDMQVLDINESTALAKPLQKALEAAYEHSQAQASVAKAPGYQPLEEGAAERKAANDNAAPTPQSQSAPWYRRVLGRS